MEAGMRKSFGPLIWWLLGSVIIGLLLAIGTQVAVVRTHGGRLDPISLFGAGQLLPGSLGSLIAVEVKLLWQTTQRDPVWPYVCFFAVVLIAAGAFWWGVILGSSQLDPAFIAVVSVIFYLFALFVVGSGVVVSES